MKSVFLVIIALVFIACSNTFNSLNPPKDPAFLYGMATGANYEDAKKSAIKDLVSSIDVSLKSSQNFLANTENGITSSKQTQNIVLSTEARNLKNIEVDTIKYIKLNGERVVFIRVHLSRLSLEKQLSDKVVSYSTKALALNTACGVRLKDRDKFKELAKKALSANLTLQSLGLHYENLSKIDNLYSLILQKPEFSFKTKGIDSNSSVALALQAELSNFVSFTPNTKTNKSIEVITTNNYIDINFYCEIDNKKDLMEGIRLDLSKPIDKLDDFDIVRLRARLYKDLLD
ncbi:hypothetical protein BKH40_01760 [Helicobacter sp. 11S02629-2]|nr:hypothetical protein BKH40_01760 [Helicobacter sp. 11S02629-2]